MELVSKQIDLPKHAAAFSDNLVELVKVMEGALADGWQPISDLPPMALACVKKLPGIIAELKASAPEALESKVKVAHALSQGAFEIAEAVLK